MSEWTPPEELEEYRVVRPVGKGAMGQVYLAHDTLLDRPVALKFVAGEVDGATRERFFVEARAIARLQHPNVVAIHRVGELKRRPWLVSEFVRGVSLNRVDKPMAWTRALEIGIGLARGLAAAHRRGVLHRDIKPHNVMLTDDGEVKLLDFGLARLLEEGERGNGEVLGTPLYMAPEAWRGEPPTRRLDVYALGVVLYELLSGSAPWQGISFAELPRRVCDQDAEPLAERVPGVDAELAAIVDRCVRRDPAERYDSADALRDALERLAQAARAPEVPEGNPYRGLFAYQAEHRGLFFGRDADISAIVDRLRSEPWLLIAGDSGVGKSSLCHAGVVPRIIGPEAVLGRPFDAVTLVPGRRPFDALIAALAPLLGQGEAQLAAQVAAEPDALGRALRKRERGTLLFADQLEELHTLADEAQASRFAETLAELLLPSPGVRVLATVRSDFLGRIAALPRLGDEVGRALHLLLPLGEQGLREAIVGPAARKSFAFESDQMVARLTDSALSAEGGLPLLSFALAELWESRDQPGKQIPEAALERLGGISGALARHADAVIARMQPGERRSARRLLTALVTEDGTRSRRGAAELLRADDPDAPAALEALVRGRLLIARESSDGGDRGDSGDGAQLGDGSYEIAHEALIAGWDTLADWLSTDAESRAARHRVERAAKEWQRLGHANEALLAGRPLDEALALNPATLADRERRFVDGSRARARRLRLRRVALFAAAPLMVGVALTGAWLQSRWALSSRVAARMSDAALILEGARARNRALEQMRAAAFAQFDDGQWQAGERAFGEVLTLSREVSLSFAQGAAAIEGALGLDPRRQRVRQELAAVTLERLLLAERDHRNEQVDELSARLAVYDDRGAHRARLSEPGRLTLDSDPPGASVTLSATPPSQPLADAAARPLGTTPLPSLSLAPGSYLLTLTRAGYAEARLPLVIARGDARSETVALLAAASVPLDFAYVPAGELLFGSADDEPMRAWLRAAPQHRVRTGRYLIARHEVTFGEYIRFLESLPPAERARRMPSALGSKHFVELRGGDTRPWELHLRPTTTEYVAKRGEPLRYPGRTRRASVDWSRLPVSGISFEDAEAYAAWLDTTGKLRGARLCDEIEWERAARGADGRRYPGGEHPGPDDFNRDLTYGREPLGFGPDEVSAHPRSRSPFGVDDLAGNVWELVRSRARAGEVLSRGGSWYQGDLTSLSANREVGDRTVRHPYLGVRLCSSLTQPQ